MKHNKMTFYELLLVLDNNIDIYVVIDGDGKAGKVYNFLRADAFHPYLVKSLKLDTPMNELNIYLKEA